MARKSLITLSGLLLILATVSADDSHSPDNGRLVLGAVLAVVGFIFLGAGIPLGGWRTRAEGSVMGLGIAATLVGLFFVINTQFGEPEETARNPFPRNQESLEIGERAYLQNCQSCHGDEGRGDGPAGLSLDPPPADLVDHVPDHGDEELFGFIHDGIPGTAMAPVGDSLTDDEVWHLVNYLRTFEE